MYVYIYIYIYIYIYVCLSVCLPACLPVCLSMHACMHACMYVCMYIHTIIYCMYNRWFPQVIQSPPTIEYPAGKHVFSIRSVRFGGSVSVVLVLCLGDQMPQLLITAASYWTDLNMIIFHSYCFMFFTYQLVQDFFHPLFFNQITIKLPSNHHVPHGFSIRFKPLGFKSSISVARHVDWDHCSAGWNDVRPRLSAHQPDLGGVAHHWKRGYHFIYNTYIQYIYI